MPIVLLDGAEFDLREVSEQCGGPGTERAKRFAARFDHALLLLSQNPAMAPRFGDRFRRLKLRDFPNGVFHMTADNRIFVSAVLDLRQDPETINRRLGQ